MPELTTRERLQPSLLDRLTDNEPGKTQESRQQRVLSVRRLRESVIRDLEWLLNSGSLSTVEDLEDYPLVETSVLNYGVSDLTGATSSGVDEHEVERMVRQAIMRFEPRILPNTVKVRAMVTPGMAEHNSLAFEIVGELWAEPMPERLILKTEVDLETGDFTVAEYADQGSV
jgi:type VI secretion system protein ImpF